ncbi:MAG: DUF362 domain-containing protein [Candidatus Eisenbacteria bacterium]
MGVTRRRFVRDLGAISVGLPLSAGIFASIIEAGPPDDSAKSSVVIIRDSGVLRDGQPIAERVAAMVRTGVTGFLREVGASDLGGILGESRRIGVKVNCLGGRPLATRPEVAYALADLVVSEIKDATVTIWDRSERELREAGFEIKPEGNVRCLATDSAGVGYESSVREAGAVGSRFSRLLTEHCDSVISIGVLKDHGIAGVSGCMKNFYGVIHNPNKYHPGGCDPYVADLYQSPLVGGKHKLSILDGLVAVYSGGPGYKPKYRWEYKGLVIGVDAVAVDRVGLDLIERQRKERGLPALAAEGREPAYIFTAGKRGLGESDLAKIKVKEMAV